MPGHPLTQVVLTSSRPEIERLHCLRRRAWGAVYGAGAAGFAAGVSANA